MTDYYGNGMSQSPFVWTAQDGVLMSNQTPIRNEVPGLPFQDGGGGSLPVFLQCVN